MEYKSAASVSQGQGDRTAFQDFLPALVIKLYPTGYRFARHHQYGPGLAGPDQTVGNVNTGKKAVAPVLYIKNISISGVERVGDNIGGGRLGKILGDGTKKHRIYCFRKHSRVFHGL